MVEDIFIHSSFTRFSVILYSGVRWLCSLTTSTHYKWGSALIKKVSPLGLLFNPSNVYAASNDESLVLNIHEPTFINSITEQDYVALRWVINTLKTQYPNELNGNDDNFWFKKIHFSKENLQTLRIVLRGDIWPSVENKFKYAFYFGRSTYAIPEDRLIFSKSHNNQENMVHLFDYIGGNLEKKDVENYIKNNMNKNAVYIYTKNQDLFKLSCRGELMSDNKILFVKDESRNFYIPYDPYAKDLGGRYLWIKDRSGDKFYKLNIKTKIRGVGKFKCGGLKDLQVIKTTNQGGAISRCADDKITEKFYSVSTNIPFYSSANTNRFRSEIN